MQISRHWRMNAQRYRLEGVQLEDGSVSLQDRHVPQARVEENTESTAEANKSNSNTMAVIHRMVS